ncbi:MAG: hypothetical protein NZ821_02190 [Gloeomargarita sp. SKYB31]|nr:hypothetical protein [Gloeomargarita sp. SKYB31]
MTKYEYESTYVLPHITVDTYPQHMQPKAPFPPEVRELIAGLKFHFRQTLSEMPLEVALLAMREAWKGCNQEQDVPPPPPSLLR